jgi:hypothetical protein
LSIVSSPLASGTGMPPTSRKCTGPADVHESRIRVQPEARHQHFELNEVLHMREIGTVVVQAQRLLRAFAGTRNPVTSAFQNENCPERSACPPKQGLRGKLMVVGNGAVLAWLEGTEKRS